MSMAATELFRIICAKSIMTGEKFLLSSGRESDYYLDLRQTTLDARAAKIIGHCTARYMERKGFNSIGGPETGAIPIVTATVLNSEKDLSGFFVRKSSKFHGTRRLIEGKAGTNVLLVDDVTTTGESLLHAAMAVGNVREAWTIVDRREGAKELLAKNGIELYSWFDESEFDCWAR